MKKYFYIITFFSIIISSVAYSQWYVQYNTKRALFDIRFIDRYTGWACGDNIILKTTNGGLNWVQQFNQGRLFGIHPVNDRVVYAAGLCTILKTSDGGETWEFLRPCALLPDLYGLWFKDENTGLFCGNQVSIRTTDGGVTFIDSVRVPNTSNDVHFKNDSVGVIAAYSKMYRTTNSGLNWDPVTLPSTLATPFIEKETFVGDTGWVASWGGVVFRTTNYGISWDSITRIPIGISERTYCIQFSSAFTGYSGVQNGKIFKTTDGGYNWIQQTQYGAASFSSIHEYNDSIVWAVGGPGIINTVNGGLTLLNKSKLNLENYKLFQNYPNPFNPTTKIKYEIKTKSHVKVVVRDVIGKVLSILVDSKQNIGQYEISFNGEFLSSGVYFYQMQVNDNLISAKKMVILK